MTTTIDRLLDRLKEARRSATMENASFGFPDDRIEVKDVHFGDDHKGRVGDVMHPTEYILKITDLYRGSWIIGPLDEAIQMVEQNRELLRQCDELRKVLQRTNIDALNELARAGMRD